MLLFYCVMYVECVLVFLLDITLTFHTTEDCLQPVICTKGHNKQSWLYSLLISSGDPFALAKLVQSIQGNVILLSSGSSCQMNKFNMSPDEVRNSDRCYINCSTFVIKQRDWAVDEIYYFNKSKRQSVFDCLNTCNECLDTTAQTIMLLLSREKWIINILIATSYEELTTLSSSIQSPVSTLLMYTVDERLHFWETLQNIAVGLKNKNLNFILMCSTACIMEYLTKAYQYETISGKTSNWLLIQTDRFEIDAIVPGMQLPKGDIVLVDNADCNKDYSPFKPVDDSLLASINLYAAHISQSTRTVRYAGHISQRGDMEIIEDLFSRWKYDLTNQTLIVSTLEWPPFVFKRTENGSIIYSGVSIELLQELSRNLNFSYKIVEPDDGEWGRVLDGRWTGLIGQLAHKRVDLVVAPIAQLDEREEVMDFTVPYFYEKSAVILKKPNPNATKWMILAAPFRLEVHMCILLSLISSTVLLFALEEMHPANTWEDNRLFARWTRYGDILWYHFGALMANGGAYLPIVQSGRSILACWWLFTVISAAIYSGNLIAFLTDWRVKPPFTSLAEMVAQDTYKWGISGGSSYITIFQNSSHPVNRKIWHGLESDPEVVSLDTDVHKRKVLGGDYAYLGETSLMERWRAEHCDLQIINDPFFPMNYGIGLHNNSAYTTLFSKQVLRINEAGLPDIWYKKWRPRAQCETPVSAKRVDLLALQSAFYVVGVGVLLAVVVLSAEVLHDRYCTVLKRTVPVQNTSHPNNNDVGQ